MLVTTEALYRRKVAALRDALPDLEHVLLVGEARRGHRGARTRATSTR